MIDDTATELSKEALARLLRVLSDCALHLRVYFSAPPYIATFNGVVHLSHKTLSIIQLAACDECLRLDRSFLSTAHYQRAPQAPTTQLQINMTRPSRPSLLQLSPAFDHQNAWEQIMTALPAESTLGEGLTK